MNLSTRILMFLVTTMSNGFSFCARFHQLLPFFWNLFTLILVI
uniref:Uncharacterized protein n=1 Tax=Arundo donax TaxID=35708 RepID=A0A0A9GGX4_ARUDO